MRLLKRYFWRAVLIPTLAILGIIVGLDCLFGFIYELEGLRGDYQAMQALQFILTTTPGVCMNTCRWPSCWGP